VSQLYHLNIEYSKKVFFFVKKQCSMPFS